MTSRAQLLERLYGRRQGSAQEWAEAQRLETLLNRERELRREEYQRYLKSPKWRSKCRAVMERDKYRCRFCGQPAVQVHHLTYVRIFNEALYDLVAICKDCHELLHKGE